MTTLRIESLKAIFVSGKRHIFQSRVVIVLKRLALQLHPFTGVGNLGLENAVPGQISTSSEAEETNNDYHSSTVF
jgi:hypothetical protein